MLRCVAFLVILVAALLVPELPVLLRVPSWAHLLLALGIGLGVLGFFKWVVERR
jgi:hypothetical protein